MAIGDQDDAQARLQQLIPQGWFPVGLTPVRDAALQGAAYVVAFLFVVLGYVRDQTRLASATDGFLDMFAGDFFGTGLMRGAGQGDSSYRARIVANLFRERGTRKSVNDLLTQVTGRAPRIFEPMRPLDTGAYGLAGGYGVAGGYGSLQLPMQSFVTAFRPPGSGIPSVAGYASPSAGYGIPSRGELASLSMVHNTADDADIYAAIDSVRPVGYTVWARISN